MTRVAYLSRAPFISGAERSLQLTIQAMPQAGVRPLVVGPAESKLRAWCQSNAIDWATCPLPLRDRWHPWAWWNALKQLRKIFSREAVELIHSNQIWSYQAASRAAHRLGIPRMCHMRDEVDQDTLAWCLDSGVDGIVCISRHIQRQVESAWPDLPRPIWCGTLLNPVEMPDERQLPERRTSKASGVTLGFIGQIREVKGTAVLLRALAQLPEHCQWRLLIAGRDPLPEQPYAKECRRLIDELGIAKQTEWLGFLDDVSEFYRQIDLAVVPSLEEPLGRIPLEAAAWAVPSIASRVGGLPETLVDGETGWLVSPGDITALATALRQFIERPDPDAGQRARDWVAARCQPAEYARQLAELYRHVIETRTSSVNAALETSPH